MSLKPRSPTVLFLISEDEQDRVYWNELEFQ